MCLVSGGVNSMAVRDEKRSIMRPGRKQGVFGDGVLRGGRGL